MQTWLEWLNKGDQTKETQTNAIVQHWQSMIGSVFSFGVYPNDKGTSLPSRTPRQFSRKTFYALCGRRWIEAVHQTEKVEIGRSFSTVTGQDKATYGFTTYWKITEKGRAALRTPQAIVRRHSKMVGSLQPLDPTFVRGCDSKDDRCWCKVCSKARGRRSKNR